MRIDLLEKLITFLTGLAVLLVAATVALLSFMPLRSGIPKEAADAVGKVDEWLQAQRATRHGGRVPQQNIPMIAASPVAPQAAAGGAAPVAQTPRDYFVDTKGGQANLPPQEVVPGYPWLRKVPGVAYMPPQGVPKLVYQRYQSFQETWDLAQSGGGEFVSTETGDNAYQINWVDPSSMLATKIGLQPGDKVISVNGQAIGTNINAGRALYDQLKNESKFAVLVERGGQKVVLSFFVRE
jgi:hypothetical protein